MIATSLFDELNISYSTGSKSNTSGWLQFTCPFCDDNKDHLGFNISKQFFHCWRCGWHPLIETLSMLSGQSKWKVSQVVERYRTKRPIKTALLKAIPPSSIKLPYGTGGLKKIHIDYLTKRGFPIQKIKEMQKAYNLHGTGPIGDYKLRILIPITYYGKLVSYQGRDITNKADKKYLACSSENEVRSHKHCLFGADLAKENTVVITEGIMDAIKLGPGAVATFGTNVSWAQILELSDRWENRYIAFDSDRAGREGAQRLTAILSAMTGNTYNVSFNKAKDPDELSFSAAEEFMNNIIPERYTKCG